MSQKPNTSLFEAQKAFLKNESNELNRSMKRKLINQENKENRKQDALISKLNRIDSNEISDKKAKSEPFKPIENIIQNVDIKVNYVTKPKEEYNTLLHLQCYSDPSYDLILNNLTQESIINVSNDEPSGLNDSFDNSLTVSRAAKIEHKPEPVVFPFDLFDELESENITTKVIKTKEIKKETAEIKMTSLIKKIRYKIPEAEEINYILDLIKKIFTKEEIKTGIFGNMNNVSTSKTQTPFDYYKVEEIKESLASKFGYNKQKLELVWTLLRPKLNTKLANFRKSLKRK